MLQTTIISQGNLMGKPKALAIFLCFIWQHDLETIKLFLNVLQWDGWRHIQIENNSGHPSWWLGLQRVDLNRRPYQWDVPIWCCRTSCGGGLCWGHCITRSNQGLCYLIFQPLNYVIFQQRLLGHLTRYAKKSLLVQYKIFWSFGLNSLEIYCHEFVLSLAALNTFLTTRYISSS